MGAISLRKVVKQYGHGPKANQVIHGVDAEIADGEFVVIVGPSGCGKSTLLRMVAGLEEITGGEIHIAGRIVNQLEPAERDIAMVFQNYALYPHMSVFDNMAFGLKLAKMPKAQIRERVQDAARILGLEELLQRKPKALSGGQRQRVAMGRAIVRHPQAFLMDEPLSNLDAKLRVQMRAEIARLQHDLGVTTIYVTHDQVEAMTMGDRVAVLRKGVLQQVENPQTLYERPVNIFVGGFIGSPAMNLFDATLQRDGDDYAVEFGGFRLGLPPEALAAHPDLPRFAGRTIVLGIRPEDMEDAALVPEAPADRRIRSTVELREALGSDVIVHFTIDAPPAMTEDAVELAVEVGTEALEQVQAQAQGGRSTLVARVNRRTNVRHGDVIELVVDTQRLHFFDPTDGLGIYGGSQ
jgi:multiple sugar transport system ATP-binding protein